MQCQRVARILFEHALGQIHDLGDPVIGLTIGRPVLPRPQVHHCFDVQHADVQIVREPLVHIAHGLRICLVVGLTIGGVTGVALAEGVDQRTFFRRRCICARPRLLNKSQRRAFVVWIHRRVDIGSENQCLSPIRHGEIRIEPSRLAERTTRLRMVERVGQIHGLIDVQLRIRTVSAHGKHVCAEVLEPRGQLPVRRSLARERRLHVMLM